MTLGSVRVLIVDDEPIVRESFGTFLRQHEYQVDLAAAGREAIELARQNFYDLVILDIRMPGMDGLDTLKELKAQRADLPVLMITAYADVATAVSAMKAGAYDYVVKPFDPDELAGIVRNVVAHQHLIRENLALRQKLQEREQFEELIGRSPKMRAVFELIQAVADTNVTVLVTGESGTGKELVARAIHRRSPRASGPFVAVNCAGLPETLMESELFGHERGAFTGAVTRHKGRFELAHGGTLFFDEIGEISPKAQVDLLRTIENKRFTRLGGSEELAVDVRIVAATNRNLANAVREGRFREDLYYRLNVVTIFVPPLRERPEDIPLLAKHFLEHLAPGMGRPGKSFSPEALALLLSHDWPGNVRELANGIERAIAVGKTELIPPEDLPIQSPTPEGSKVCRTLAEWECQHVGEVLTECSWNITRAATVLGIDRVTLYSKIKRFGLQRPAEATRGKIS